MTFLVAKVKFLNTENYDFLHGSIRINDPTWHLGWKFGRCWVNMVILQLLLQEQGSAVVEAEVLWLYVSTHCTEVTEKGGMQQKRQAGQTQAWKRRLRFVHYPNLLFMACKILTSCCQYYLLYELHCYQEDTQKMFTNIPSWFWELIN